MTPHDIYQLIYQSVHDFWSMFLNIDTLYTFEFLCAHVVLTLSMFFLGFLVLFGIIKIFSLLCDWF